MNDHIYEPSFVRTPEVPGSDLVSPMYTIYGFQIKAGAMLSFYTDPGSRYSDHRHF